MLFIFEQTILCRYKFSFSIIYVIVLIHMFCSDCIFAYGVPCTLFSAAIILISNLLIVLIRLIYYASGGTILRLCEEAGRIAGTKWSRGPVALVGASKTHFRQPIHVGEVATVDASVDYVGRHAIRVGMTVQAENMETGHKRLTNTASMWYSTVDIDSDSHTMKVGSRKLHPLHPAQVATDAAEEHAYFASARAKIPLDSREEEEFPVVLADLPGPDAIANGPFLSAGYILKLMDSGAALAAVFFARTSCVTVLLDKVCFHTPITVGDLCTIRAGVTYTSKRSLEVVAQVWKSNSGIVGGLCKDEDTAPACAVEARFVFVALGSDGKVADVPQLPEELRTKRWDVGAAKHAERQYEKHREE